MGPYNFRKLKKGYKINLGPYTKVYPIEFFSINNIVISYDSSCALLYGLKPL